MKTFIRDAVIALALVAAVVLVIKPAVVKANSMEPTLYENNYLLVNRQAYRFGDVERGDIIVFESKLRDKNNRQKLLIKRVIGLPGDVISIKNSRVYRNGEELREDYILDGNPLGDVVECTVPDGQLFVMGDNRRVSIDSRSSKVGCVSREDVLGKAFIRLYPFNKIGGIY